MTRALDAGELDAWRTGNTFAAAVAAENADGVRPAKSHAAKDTEMSKDILTYIASISKSQWRDPSENVAIFIVDVTPTLAAMLLDGRPVTQRPVNALNVSKLRRCIASGRYRWTGIPIVMTNVGGLIDGQHRVRAALDEGFTLQNQVVSVVADADVYRAIDVAARRSRTDQLRYAQAGRVLFNSAAQAGLVYEHVDFIASRKAALSTDEETDIVMDAEMGDVALALQCAGKPTGPMIAAAVRCAYTDPVAAMEFFRGSLTNDHNLFGRPSGACRIVATRMLNPRLRPSGMAAESRDEVSIYIKAFLDWFAGEDGASRAFYRAAKIPSRKKMRAVAAHARAMPLREDAE